MNTRTDADRAKRGGDGYLRLLPHTRRRQRITGLCCAAMFAGTLTMPFGLFLTIAAIWLQKNLLRRGPD